MAPFYRPGRGQSAAKTAIDSRFSQHLFLFYGFCPPIGSAIPKLEAQRTAPIVRAQATCQPCRLSLRLLGAALVWFGLFCQAAAACSIERNSIDTVTIRGICDEELLLAQLKVAVHQMELRSEAREKLASAADTPDPPSRKIDLVNGQVKGNARTFFHRSPARK